MYLSVIQNYIRSSVNIHFTFIYYKLNCFFDNEFTNKLVLKKANKSKITFL